MSPIGTCGFRVTASSTRTNMSANPLTVPGSKRSVAKSTAPLIPPGAPRSSYSSARRNSRSTFTTSSSGSIPRTSSPASFRIGRSLFWNSSDTEEIGA